MADFYIRTAAALEKVLSSTLSVKAAASPHADSKRVLALLVNTLAYRSALTHVLGQVDVVQLERKTFGPNGKDSKVQALLLVLMHDLLFAARGIQAAKTWSPKKALDKHKSRLHSELVRLQLKLGKSRIQDLKAGAASDDSRSHHEIVRTIPRWARVNELKTTVKDVQDWLKQHGWKLVQGDGLVELTASNTYAVSSHIPSLLAFPPKSTSTLLASELYTNGRLVLQDLASCMPAQILNPLQWEQGNAEIEAIDATSAPGNKTSHLSALMKGKGKVSLSILPRKSGTDTLQLTAFERSDQRYKTLTKLIGRAGALRGNGSNGNVETVNMDFLKTDPTEARWKNVRYMLVDPSCSGSGIVNRLDYLKEEEDEQVEGEQAIDTNSVQADAPAGQKRKHSNGDTKGPADAAVATKVSKKQQRLDKLAEFQLLMVRHAMRFPSLQRLAYSTCSIHATENEHVVIRALATTEAAEGGWTLASRDQVLPSWPVRGKPEECPDPEASLADSMIRCIPGGKNESKLHPNTESSNGFFVACFTRSSSAEEQRKRRKTEQNRKKKIRKLASAARGQGIEALHAGTLREEMALRRLDCTLRTKGRVAVQSHRHDRL